MDNIDDETEFKAIILLKYGKLEHLQDLLYNGVIYASSIEKIREKETKESADFRNDPLEGIRKYTSVRPTKVTLISVLNKNLAPIEIYPENIKYWETPEKILGNICSFYGITTKDFINNQLIPIDTRMKEFGSHFILIKDFWEFIRRIDKAIEQTTKTTWHYGFVKYFNEEDYKGEIDLFHKRSRYKHQKEFRLYFKTKSNEPFFIKIGNIEDIATIINSEATEHMKMTVNLEQNFCDLKFPIITNDSSPFK